VVVVVFMEVLFRDPAPLTKLLNACISRGFRIGFRKGFIGCIASFLLFKKRLTTGFFDTKENKAKNAWILKNERGFKNLFKGHIHI